MKLISVIVPVYKAEQFLDKCVDSIVKQTYSNLEIILVDDGSPDCCGAMCDVWAQKDRRVKVIHIENGGAGRARNIGLGIAKGDFISFVDSDDYLSAQMYEIMMHFFNREIDIVECDYIIAKDDLIEFKKANDCIKKSEYKTKEAMKEHIKDQIFKQIIWNKLYRHDVIRGILFPEKKLIDDEFWTYQVIGQAKKLIHINESLYVYRQQPDSVMHRSFSLQRLQAIEAKKNRLEYIQKYFPELFEEAHRNFWLSCLYVGQMSLKYLNKTEYEQAFEIIKCAMKEYPLKFEKIKKFSVTDKVWGCLSEISIFLTCKLRNLLKIGF